MPAGIVRFFNAQRGVGYVSPDDGLDDILIRMSAVNDSGLAKLNQGDIIEFAIEHDRKAGKFIATNLTVLEAHFTQQPELSSWRETVHPCFAYSRRGCRNTATDKPD